MHPTATTLRPVSCACSNASMLSRLAASTKPQVLTTIASASSGSSTSIQPSLSSRAASSSESTSLRAQPRVTRETDRGTRPGYGLAPDGRSGELDVAAALDGHVRHVALGARRPEVTAVGDEVDGRRVADEQTQPALVLEDLRVTLAEQALVELPAVESPHLQPGAVGDDAHEGNGGVDRHLGDGAGRRAGGGAGRRRRGLRRLRRAAVAIGGLLRAAAAGDEADRRQDADRDEGDRH